MGHLFGSNLSYLTVLFDLFFFTSINKGSFSYISDKKLVSIRIKPTDFSGTTLLKSSEVVK